MKTYSAKPSDVERKWFVVDAASAPLGRMATQVATLLRGKHKPMYTPHIDTGDHVVIINSDQLQLTGQKMDQKIYDRYSGYTGGRYERTAREQLEIDSTEMVRSAVRGMLPKTKLGRQMITKLKVYTGSEHPHTAQNPETFELNV
ncbi:50S ribosomal protein L13 [bacterium]|nr:MAG: 50S ribosomal protein L13 [bacterium]